MQRVVATAEAVGEILSDHRVKPLLMVPRNGRFGVDPLLRCLFSGNRSVIDEAERFDQGLPGGVVTEGDSRLRADPDGTQRGFHERHDGMASDVPFRLLDCFVCSPSHLPLPSERD